MPAIVMNTRTGAVTEYDGFDDFNSITSTHAASSAGLFTLGGDTDDGEAIDATFLGPRLGGAEVRRPDQVNLAIRGPEGSAGEVRIAAGGKSQVKGTEFAYRLAVQKSGLSRCEKPGLGLRENFLAYGYRNLAGAAFTISQYLAEEIISTKRKAV